MDSNIENVENLLKYSKCGMEEFIKEDKIDYSKIPINIINQYRDDLLSKGIFTGCRVGVLIKNNNIFFPVVITLNKLCSQLFFLNDIIYNDNNIDEKHIIDILITDKPIKNSNYIGEEKINMFNEKIYIYLFSQNNYKKSIKEREYVFFTSGTTGKSDMVYKKESSICKEAISISRKLKFQKNEKMLVIAPTFHAYGNAYSCFAAAFAGVTVKYLPNISTKTKILKELQSNEYNILLSTPFYFEQLIENEECLSKLRLKVCSGGKVGKKIFSSKVNINNAYGSTETGAISIQTFESGGSNTDVGNEYDGVEVMFLKDNKKNDLKGSVVIKSDYIAHKIVTQKEEQIINNNTIVLKDEGYRNSNDDIVILGRKDRIVNIAGEKISLNEVEEILYKIGNVKETRVVVKLDNDMQEYLCAYVVLNDKNMPINLRGEMMKYLPISKIPKKIYFKDFLLKTETGKIKEKQE